MEEDSYQQYKTYLEEFIKEADNSELKPPKQPFNAYVHFVLDKSSAQRLKNPSINWNDLKGKLTQEWKDLSEAGRRFYEEAYNRRIREREKVLREYNRVSKQKKILTPYIRFFKKAYPIYQNIHTGQNISAMITKEWSNMDQSKKKAYKTQYEQQKLLSENTMITSSDIDSYKELKAKYEREITEEKDKVSRAVQIAKNTKNFKKFRQAQVKAKKEVEKAFKKQQKQEGKAKTNQKVEADQDSEEVDDLLKKIRDKKKTDHKKKITKDRKPRKVQSSHSSSSSSSEQKGPNQQESDSSSQSSQEPIIEVKSTAKKPTPKADKQKKLPKKLATKSATKTPVGKSKSPTKQVKVDGRSKSPDQRNNAAKPNQTKKAYSPPSKQPPGKKPVPNQLVHAVAKPTAHNFKTKSVSPAKQLPAQKSQTKKKPVPTPKKQQAPPSSSRGRGADPKSASPAKAVARNKKIKKSPKPLPLPKTKLPKTNTKGAKANLRNKGRR